MSPRLDGIAAEPGVRLPGTAESRGQPLRGGGKRLCVCVGGGAGGWRLMVNRAAVGSATGKLRREAVGDAVKETMVVHAPTGEGSLERLP